MIADLSSANIFYSNKRKPMAVVLLFDVIHLIDLIIFELSD